MSGFQGVSGEVSILHASLYIIDILRSIKGEIMEKTANGRGLPVLLCICVVLVVMLGSCGGGGESGDGEFQPVLAMLNGQTYAWPDNHSAAINDQGDIFVVWSMWRGAGLRLLYSYYDASSGTWLGEYEFDTSGDFPADP